MLSQRPDNEIVIKKAYCYVRVSSEEQVENYSLDNQLDYCRNEATRQGYDIEGIYREEGVSAKNINRPQLIKLLEDSRKNRHVITAVFIYKIDRLSRETSDYLLIKKRLADYGIRIISVTEPTEANPTGDFTETMLAAIAKLDNATKSLRTIDGMRKRLESGWANGKAPVGYLNVTNNDKPIIEPDPEQFDLVKKAWVEMATGNYTLETIANYMNKLGIIVKKGKKSFKLRNQQTQRLFRDKFYCGYVFSKRFEIDKIGNHKPMINESIFYRVQAILDHRSYTGGIHYSRINENFPLRGDVICGNCGSALSGSYSKGRHDKYPYYFCLKCRPSKSIPKDDFEESFLKFMAEYMPNKQLTHVFTAMVKNKWQSRYSHLETRLKAIENDLKALHEVRKRLVRKHLEGVYSDEIYEEQMAEIGHQMLVKNTIKDEAKLQTIDIDIIVNFMDNFLWNMDKAWREGTIHQRKLLTGSIFPKKLTFTNGEFRTAELGPCFKLIKQFRDTPISSWVTDS